MQGDPRLRKVLGGILKVGNCLNAGNKTRERADGFLLEALGKATNIRSGDGRTILQVVCATLCQDDAEFRGFKSNFSHCQAALKSIVDDVEKACDKVKAELGLNKRRF